MTIRDSLMANTKLGWKRRRVDFHANVQSGLRRRRRRSILDSPAYPPTHLPPPSLCLPAICMHRRGGGGGLLAKVTSPSPRVRPTTVVGGFHPPEGNYAKFCMLPLTEILRRGGGAGGGEGGREEEGSSSPPPPPPFFPFSSPSRTASEQPDLICMQNSTSSSSSNFQIWLNEGSARLRRRLRCHRNACRCLRRNTVSRTGGDNKL